jgi:type II restriction enzyme
MPLQTLSKDESSFLEKVLINQYMKPIQKRIDIWVEKSGNPQYGWKIVFDHLDEILKDFQDDLDKILDIRLSAGEISDKKQAIRSICGNLFVNTIIYVFIQNKLVGNIPEGIFINNKSVVPEFEKVFTITIGEHLEKLNINLIIYSLKENSELNKCIALFPLQSDGNQFKKAYKWKLLMEIAMSDCEVRDKYEITYDPPTVPLVCFVTVNFYNEINNPQHRGMFKFFDRAFIGKPIDPQITNFISPLSTLIGFVNEKLI